MEQLLSTKLYIPPTRPDLVHRLRLLDQLNACAYPGCRLILISAPAGFGKTTLVSEWVKTMGRATPPIAISWLSLDEGDNDCARFLTYFIAALNQAEGIEAAIGKGSLSMLQSPQPPPTEAILTSLLNEIAAIPNRVIFVLDDYHIIASSQVDDALAFFLEHLPPRIHLVIATRDDPHLPLSRLRARSQLTELRATDLRFTSSEAAEFLNQTMGLNLTMEDIVALETRTEGWIVGLQLAALSMQGHEDTSSLIKTFTGSHRLVVDFLIEEVLSQQPQSIQNFLLHTAVLDQLTGSLCDAVCFGPAETDTKQDSSQEILVSLERDNLFIVPLDGERCWYRYHHLFADLLRQRLHQTQPEQLSVLHRRASEWYEQNGFEDETIEYALRAKAFERAAHLIEEQADALWQRGEHGKLRRWLEGIPDELVISKPQICIFRAYYLQSGGQYLAGEHLLQETEKLLEISSDRVGEDPLLERNQSSGLDRVKLQGRMAVVRALIDSINGDVPGIIQYANQALEFLPEGDLTWRSLAAFSLGDAHSFLGDMSASYQARSEALKACEATGDIFYIIVANLKLVSTLREQGELLRTLEICQQQMQLADEYGLSQTSPVGCLLALWGEVLAEQNDLNGAIQQAKKGVEIAERGGNLLILGFSYLYLMRVLISRGDLAGAEEIIQKVVDLDRETTVPPWLISQMANWKARMCLMQDDLVAASHWAEERGLYTDGELKTLGDIDFLLLFDYITLARILIAQSRLDEAIEFLQRLVEPAETGRRTTRVIEILILQALALQISGDKTQAMIKLEKALTLAETGGFIRTFVDEGPPMEALLKEMKPEDVKEKEYVRKLLAAFGEKELPPSSLSPQTLIEPLSEREIEVLQLVAEGLTNQVIATRLYLSVHTVKTHTRNINSKLDAHNRTEAVTKARVLGILPFT